MKKLGGNLLYPIALMAMGVATLILATATTVTGDLYWSSINAGFALLLVGYTSLYSELRIREVEIRLQNHDVNKEIK